MKQRMGAALAGLCVGLLAVTLVAPAASASRPATLTVPGDDYYPESISAAANGDLYVGSITTGAITRFRAGSSVAEPFVAAGVNVGTAGVLVDDARRVLWTCNIDLSFQQPTSLRAFSLRTGTPVADYVLPDGGVCADITNVRGALFITDTTNPTASPQAPGRILKLTTPNPVSAAGGTLSVWSADPAFTAGPGLQINGIAFDGFGTLYTTNYGSGQLIRVRIAPDGSAQPAELIATPRPLVNPDGIRMLSPTRLLITENPGRVSYVDVRTGAVVLISDAVDQPTSVVRVGRDLWVAEGQVLRLQAGEAPHLPFTVRRVPLPAGL
ncbi:hypothetical protein Dvina_02000 [Dactylosporangium vinaceum]|uniref:SMP-30/gluconolactonase/LRE family protein n=1 Tax=Dactylosporangium vinaceum TaxID=53362 RepID=A0ABV5MF37_9ACTN|nr:hypothetical protein [Dactylosporangium vinaceum]UAB97009.1 hypothetical protein Dvina_02000 [Dactylosporangium vinaceum]